MDSTRDLLVRGVAAAKAHSVNEARFFFEWVLRVLPSLPEKIEALYWLSSLADTPAEEREYLNTILAEEPNEPRALRRLLILDGKLQEQDLIDPEVFRPDQNSTVTVTADRFTCPKCGGRMTYAPDGLSLKCEYCSTRQMFNRKAGRPSDEALSGEDFIASMATANGHTRAVATQFLTCRGCGAEFLVTESRISVTCPFCHSSEVIDVSVIRQMIPPARIIPLQINQAEAKKSAAEKFPSALRLENDADIRPAFYPVWEFEMNGRIVRRMPVSVLSDNMEETTFDIPVKNQVVQVMAIDGALSAIHGLEDDFDYSYVELYSPGYLVDCLAVGYTVPVADAALLAREKLVKSLHTDARIRMGPRVGEYFIDSSGLYISKFWLTLVPVWNYSHANEGIVALINGQTGAARTGKTNH